MRFNSIKLNFLRKPEAKKHEFLQDITVTSLKKTLEVI